MNTQNTNALTPSTPVPLAERTDFYSPTAIYFYNKTMEELRIDDPKIISRSILEKYFPRGVDGDDGFLFRSLCVTFGVLTERYMTRVLGLSYKLGDDGQTLGDLSRSSAAAISAGCFEAAENLLKGMSGLCSDNTDHEMFTLNYALFDIIKNVLPVALLSANAVMAGDDDGDYFVETVIRNVRGISYGHEYDDLRYAVHCLIYGFGDYRENGLRVVFDTLSMNNSRVASLLFDRHETCRCEDEGDFVSLFGWHVMWYVAFLVYLLTCVHEASVKTYGDESREYVKGFPFTTDYYLLHNK